MKSIHFANALYFYDGVQIFDARDAIGGHYLGLLVGDDSSGDRRYLVVGASPENLQGFRIGKLDLRSLIEKRSESDWFMANAPADFSEALPLQPQDGPIPEEYLPQPGFLLHGEAVSSQAGEVRVEALARNRIVFELTLETPEGARAHKIRAGTLCGVLIHLQSLLKHAYARATRALSTAERKAFGRELAPLLDVAVPAAPGSFRVVLEAAQAPDLFGGGEVAKALDIVDEIAALSSDPEQTLACAHKYRGHTVSAYVRLLRYMIEAEVSVQYAWASPDRSDVLRRAITEPQAQPLVAILAASESLGTEAVTLVGQLRKADVDTGAWRLKNAEDNKEYSGRVRPGVSLSHLVTDGTYRFVCEEEVEEVTGTGREMRTLYLKESATAAGS